MTTKVAPGPPLIGIGMPQSKDPLWLKVMCVIRPPDLVVYSLFSLLQSVSLVPLDLTMTYQAVPSPNSCLPICSIGQLLASCRAVSRTAKLTSSRS